MTSDTPCQRTFTVSLDGQTVVVRRLRAKAARSLLKQIAAHVASLGTSLSDVLPKIPELITKVDELVIHLVVNSTELTAEQYDNLDILEASQVLAAAVKLNLGPELKNCWTGIAEDLGAILPVPAKTLKTSAASTPSS